MIQPSDDNVPWEDRVWAASKTIPLCVMPVVDHLIIPPRPFLHASWSRYYCLSHIAGGETGYLCLCTSVLEDMFTSEPSKQRSPRRLAGIMQDSGCGAWGESRRRRYREKRKHQLRTLELLVWVVGTKQLLLRVRCQRLGGPGRWFEMDVLA